MLFLCVAATYWKVLKYPFIQDDWGILFSIVEMDDFEIVQQAFLPEGKLFYRPLGITYFVLAHLFFGLNSLGYHLLALGLHFVNSLLVVRISGLFLQGNKLLPWLAGILYGTAIAVHMDPLLMDSRNLRSGMRLFLFQLFHSVYQATTHTIRFGFGARDAF